MSLVATGEQQAHGAELVDRRDQRRRGAGPGHLLDDDRAWRWRPRPARRTPRARGPRAGPPRPAPRGRPTGTRPSRRSRRRAARSCRLPAARTVSRSSSCSSGQLNEANSGCSTPAMLRVVTRSPLRSPGCQLTATRPSSAPVISARPTPRAWPSWATRSSAWTSTPARSPQLAAGAGAVLRARARRAARAATSRRAGCGSPLVRRGRRDFGDVHFVCVGTPQQAGEYAADLELRRRRHSTRSAAAPDPRRHSSSASRPCRSAPRRGSAPGSATRPRPALTSSWSGTRSSCARASRSRTRCTRTGWCSASRRRRGRASLREVYAPLHRRRHPGGRHRPGHRRAGQGRRERVPGHQDLLHQRDGRGLRGDRRRRDEALARRCRTTPGSAAGSCTPGSASAAAACPRTSARSWPGPASWASTRR